MNTFIKIMLTGLLAMSLSVSAAEIGAKNGVLYINGSIVEGDFEKVREALASGWVSKRTILLNSGGGDAKEAILLANLVIGYDFSTIVLKSCRSACSFIFMAGVYKYLGENAYIGIHRPKITVLATGAEREDALQSSLWWSIYGVLRAGGNTEEQTRLFLKNTYNTPHASGYYIYAEDAEEYGLEIVPQK